jgi:hypothetical protein
MITIVFQLLLDRTQIHRLLDYLKIIRETELNRIDRTVKDPPMLMRLKNLEHFKALGLELLRSQL